MVTTNCVTGRACYLEEKENRDGWRLVDTYRAAHPLRLLIDEETEKNVINSYLLMAEQMGNMWMPTFPEITGDSRRMNSNHAVATIADAAAKGLQFDLKKAYEACRKGIEDHWPVIRNR